MLRPVLVACLLAAAVAPAALAKELTSVVVIGPKGPPLVEPAKVARAVIGAQLRLVAPPHEPYALVYPLMRGVPARPGRWYPRSGILCSGWRSGVEAGCAAAAELRGWLGGGSATGLYVREPVRIVRLQRGGALLRTAGNEAAALQLAFHQRAERADAVPADCVPFRARWSSPGHPASFCVSPSGGVYAGTAVYPLPAAAARFVTGR